MANLDTQYNSFTIREPVAAFSWKMEEKLLQNDKEKGEDGWKDAPREALVNGLQREFAELLEALVKGYSPKEIMSECADVANFAMMIADNLGGGLGGI